MKKRLNAAQIICGIGFGILLIGGCGMDSVDMTRPIIFCAIGLGLMIMSAPFMAKESKSEEDSVSDYDDTYSRNYPYDKAFRRR